MSAAKVIIKVECPLCHYALYPNTGLCTNEECPEHRKWPSKAMPIEEFLHDYEPPPLYHGRRWGDWRFDAERLCLNYEPEGRWRYEIDLERVWDSASLLDWIFQVCSKTWATAQVSKDLLNALENIFHPQANLCSFGSNKKIEPAKFLRSRMKERER